MFNSQESFSQHSQRLEYLSKEIDYINNGIAEIVTSENFFNGNELFSRREAVQYIKDFYGLRKKLQNENKESRGSFKIHLKCSFPNCGFHILCRKGRNSCFAFDESSSNLNHGIFDDEGTLIGLCTDWNGNDRLSTKDILKDPVYQSLKNCESNRKNSKNGKISIDGTINVVSVSKQSSSDRTIISENRVKKANLKNKISSYEHIIGFSKLSPYLELFRSLNPGFQYQIEKSPDTINEFRRLAVLFPYAISAQKYCFKVYGIDAAHIQTHEIRKGERKDLEDLLNWPPEMRIMFAKYFLFAVSGRTINNEMIIFALGIGHSECIEDYEFLFQFLTDNGFDMNKPDVTILTDRGKSILACILKFYYLAFLKPCSVHLKRNLIDNGFNNETLISLYWKATNACTKYEYDKVIVDMRSSCNGKGEKMFKYLEKVSNWQLYKAIKRGNIIYGINSDNLVEIIFSWLREARSYVTPYYILSYIMMQNVDRLMTIQEECFVEHDLGLTTRASDIYTENNLELNITSVDVHPTDIYQLCGYVYLLSDNKVRTKKYNVNLTNRTCDCYKYQQTGCPCIHAIALIRNLKVSMKKQYFYEFCFVEYLEKMFDAGKILQFSQKLTGSSSYINKFATVLPNDDDINAIIEEDSDGKHTLIPSIIGMDTFETSTSSDKRIRSKGDHAKSSNRKVSRKITCSKCNKVISRTTRHGPSACLKYYKLMNDGKEPEITKIVDK